MPSITCIRVPLAAALLPCCCLLWLMPVHSLALLSTYNFHQPVQLNRLFKTDPREQMALMDSGVAFSDPVERGHIVPALAGEKMPGPRAAFLLDSMEQQPPQPHLRGWSQPQRSRSLKTRSMLDDSVDLNGENYALFRRMIK